MPLIEKRHLFPAALESPVQIIELQLTEFHILSVGVKEAFQHIHTSMAGEAQMFDPPVSLLLHQIAVDTILFIIQIRVNVHLTDVMEEIEVKIFHLQLFQLPFEDLLHMPPVGRIISRELGRDIELLPRMILQRLTHDDLRVLAVITPGRIIIIDSCRHRSIHHTKRGSLIDPAIIPIEHRKAHSSKAKRGQLQFLKNRSDHDISAPSPWSIELFCLP